MCCGIHATHNVLILLYISFFLKIVPWGAILHSLGYQEFKGFMRCIKPFSTFCDSKLFEHLPKLVPN